MFGEEEGRLVGQEGGFKCNMLGTLYNKLKGINCTLIQNRYNMNKPNSGISKHFKLRSYNLSLEPDSCIWYQYRYQISSILPFFCNLNLIMSKIEYVITSRLFPHPSFKTFPFHFPGSATYHHHNLCTCLFLSMNWEQ